MGFFHSYYRRGVTSEITIHLRSPFPTRFSSFGQIDTLALLAQSAQLTKRYSFRLSSQKPKNYGSTHMVPPRLYCGLFHNPLMTEVGLLAESSPIGEFVAITHSSRLPWAFLSLRSYCITDVTSGRVWRSAVTSYSTENRRSSNGCISSVSVLPTGNARRERDARGKLYRSLMFQTYICVSMLLQAWSKSLFSSGFEASGTEHLKVFVPVFLLMTFKMRSVLMRRDVVKGRGVVYAVVNEHTPITHKGELHSSHLGKLLFVARRVTNKIRSEA